MPGAGRRRAGPAVRPRGGVAALPIVVLSLASAAGHAAAPYLLPTNPLLLVALAPRTAHLVIAAAVVPLPVFLLVGAVRLGLADPSHYVLGRMHGEGVAAAAGRLSPAAGRALRWMLRLDQRGILLAVAVHPVGKTLLLAGASRVPPWRVAGADIAGTLVQLVALHAAGGAAVRALSPSPATLRMIAMATLVGSAAGAALAARSGAGARTAAA